MFRADLSLSCLLFLLCFCTATAQSLLLQEKYRIDLPDSTDRVLIAKFSSDGSKILLVNQKSTQVWSAKSGKLLVTFQEPMRSDNGFDISWQPGGSRILQYNHYGRRESAALVWDGETGRKIATLQEEAGVIRAEWNSSGDRILTVGDHTKGGWSDHFTFSVRDADGKVIRTERHIQHGFYLIRLSATGDKVIVSQRPRRNGEPIETFDRDSGRLLQGFNHGLPKLNPLTHPIFAGESPDGKYLCGQIDLSKGIVCWRSDSGQPVYYFLDTKETGDNFFLSFSPDSKKLAVLRSRQKTIDIADAATGQIQFTIAGIKLPYVTGIAAYTWLRGFEYRDLWSSDGSECVATDIQKEVSLWNLKSKELVSRRPAICDSDNDWFVGMLPEDYETFRFNPYNELLLSVSNQVVRIWNTSNGALLKEIAFPFNKKGENTEERDVSHWSPNGELLTTAANNNRTLILWSVAK